MNTVRQGDITGFDDAEVIDVEDTENEEVIKEKADII